MARLLLVDDNATILRLLEHVLTGQGYEVMRVDSGTEALRVAAMHRFDGALVDLNLGGTTGMELCRLLRQHSAQFGNDFPVWLLTGALAPEVAERARQAGARNAFPKPIRMPQLLEALAGELHSGPAP